MIETKAEVQVSLDQYRLPPCQVACPLHMDIQGYVSLIAQGRYAEALEVIRETNPLPSICGRICFHPCETECRRGKVDEPLAIASLKRFAAEAVYEAVSTPIPKNGKKVAVIGGGPAGLTAAHDLARLGYEVAIFERGPSAGGALRTGIPQYRLPVEAMDKDIQAILDLGVKLYTNTEVGKDLTLADLKKQGYQAILISAGLPVSRGLRIPGVEREGVLLALPFLNGVKWEGLRIKPGTVVIVIGGGNVAVDVARCALRVGAAKVKMVCLEARHEMPAFPWEIEEALHEEIELYPSWGPKAILGDGRITGLECMAVKAVFDDQGRFNPTFYEDRLSVVDGDMVIIAIGQASDLGLVKDSQVQLNERGQLIFDRQTMMTTEEGIFACGEVVTGPGAAVQAMAHGRRAALAMDWYLSGKDLSEFKVEEPPALDPLVEPTLDRIKRINRQRMPAIPPSERVSGFDEVELGFDEEMAVREAQRCLLCGSGGEIFRAHCALCLTCVRVCPYGVPVLKGAGVVEIRLDQCQTCGLCASECPGKAITLRRYRDEPVTDLIQAALTGATSPVILGVICGYGPFALSSFDRYLAAQAPPQLRLVKIPCLSKLESGHILKAFELGADAVLVVGCQEEDCHIKDTPLRARRRVDYARKILEEVGLDGERLELVTLAAPAETGVVAAASKMLERLLVASGKGG